VVRIKVCAKLIKRGAVTKPMRRTWKPEAAPAAATPKKKAS
jgi:hypothetical protein